MGRQRFLEDVVMQRFVFLGRTPVVVVSAAAALALAACGGGDDPAPPRAADLPPVTVTASNVQLARSVAGLLVGSSVTLPALTSDNEETIPEGTKLEFADRPSDAPSTAIAGFKMTQGSDVLEGYIEAGSAIFVVTRLNGSPFSGVRYVFTQFVIDPSTEGLSVGPQQIGVTVSFGRTSVVVQVNVRVEQTSDGSLSLTTARSDVSIPLIPITGA